jgi:hypothetical protein
MRYALTACEGLPNAANNADSTNAAVITFLMIFASLVYAGQTIIEDHQCDWADCDEPDLGAQAL